MYISLYFGYYCTIYYADLIRRVRSAVKDERQQATYGKHVMSSSGWRPLCRVPLHHHPPKWIVFVSQAWKNIQGGPKNGTVFLFALTSSNINRFSKLFHCQNQEKICNNTITKDPTTPQACRYTTLWNVKCVKSNNSPFLMRLNRKRGDTPLRL